jgi:hypothetical protein
METNYYNYIDCSQVMHGLNDAYFDAKYEYEQAPNKDNLERLNKINSEIDRVEDLNKKFVEKYVCEYCLIFSTCKREDCSCEKYEMYRGACYYKHHHRIKENYNGEYSLIIRKMGDHIVTQPLTYDASSAELEFHNTMLNKFKNLSYFEML